MIVKPSTGDHFITSWKVETNGITIETVGGQVVVYTDEVGNGRFSIHDTNRTPYVQVEMDRTVTVFTRESEATKMRAALEIETKRN